MMLAALCGLYECSPAMPCSPPKLTQERRCKDEECRVPIECLCSQCDVREVSVRVPCAITKLLDYRETRSNPRAVEAVQAEIEALGAVGIWD